MKFYNTTDTTVSVDMTKSLNTAADPTDFRIDFDLKTMGNNIYCFLQEYGFLTTDVLVNLIGNKVQGQYVTTTGSKAYQDLMNYEYMQRVIGYNSSCHIQYVACRPHSFHRFYA